MANHAEVIQKQMAETRSQLTDKLEKLEDQVSDTVQNTTEAVSETVEAVKDTVENVTSGVKETLQAVCETFDLRLQTERNPWVVFGASVAVGCLAAQMFGHREGRSTQQKAPASPPSAEPRSWFWEELDKLKGLALGAVMGVARDMVRTGLPGAVGERVADEVDHLTNKLGGTPIQGPVLTTEK